MSDSKQNKKEETEEKLEQNQEVQDSQNDNENTNQENQNLQNENENQQENQEQQEIQNNQESQNQNKENENEHNQNESQNEQQQQENQQQQQLEQEENQEEKEQNKEKTEEQQNEQKSENDQQQEQNSEKKEQKQEEKENYQDQQQQEEIQQQQIQNEQVQQKEEVQQQQNEGQQQESNVINQEQKQENNSEQQQQQQQVETKLDQETQPKKQKKRIFDDIKVDQEKNTSIPRKQVPLTIDLTQYQTDLDQSVDMHQIQQFHQENLQKSQQYQQQHGKHYYSNNQEPQRQQQQYEVDEHGLLCQAKLERKRENFKMLKDWDMQRAMFLNTHRGILETIQANIDQLLVMSQQQAEFFIKFFTNKCQQEANYSQIPINQQKQMLQQNPLTQNFELYQNFQNIIQNFEEKNLDSVKKAAEFAKIIDIDILRECILKDYDKHNQIIGQIRAVLIQLRDDITKLNQLTQKKSQKLSLLYHSSTPKQGYPMMPTHKRVHKDLYKKQLGFLRKAIQQQTVQKSIAQHTIEFWVQAKNLEVERANAFHEALKKYHNGFLQRYGQISEEKEKEDLHLKLLEQIPNKEKIEDIFSIKNILSQKEIDTVKELFGYEAEQDLKFEDLQKYLEKFQIQDFNDRFLVMKEWVAGREIAPNVYKDTKIITTADNFIQCFDIVKQLDQNGKEIQQKYKKPEISMYLSKPTIIPYGGGVVEIKISATNFIILKSKTTNFFKFKSDDSVEEFIQHISNL